MGLSERVALFFDDPCLEHKRSLSKNPFVSAIFYKFVSQFVSALTSWSYLKNKIMALLAMILNGDNQGLSAHTYRCFSF
jgi:hypothetical protein